jgi:hypothetical protein
MNEDIKKQYKKINVNYVNKKIMLAKGIPSTVLITILPFLIVQNIYVFVLSILFAVIIIKSENEGYIISDIKKIYKYIRRKSNTFYKKIT